MVSPGFFVYYHPQGVGVKGEYVSIETKRRAVRDWLRGDRCWNREMDERTVTILLFAMLVFITVGYVALWVFQWRTALAITLFTAAVIGAQELGRWIAAPDKEKK